MNRRNMVRLGLSALCAAAICAAIFCGASFPGTGGALTAIRTADPAALDPSFGALDDGSVYVHTDYGKAGLDDDTVGVIVDRTQPHGSEENPFVIRNITDWASFAAKTEYGAQGSLDTGNVWVLGGDLNFNGGEIPGVDGLRLNSRFYGRGYTISNGTIKGHERRRYGALFAYTFGDVVIADLNVQGVSAPSGQSNTANTNARGGTIIGLSGTDRSIGALAMLNVHVDRGDVSVIASVPDAYVGGLVGNMGPVGADGIGGANAIFYKSGFNGSVEGHGTSPSSGSIGGLIGRIGKNDSITIDNCYFNGTLTSTAGTSTSRKLGGLIGIIGSKGKLVIKNSYVKGEAITNGGTTWIGGLVGLLNTETDLNVTEVTFSNCFSDFTANNSSASTRVTNAPVTTYYTPSSGYTIPKETLFSVQYAKNHSMAYVPQTSARQSLQNTSKELKAVDPDTFAVNAKNGLADYMNIDNVAAGDSAASPVHASKINDGYSVKYYVLLDGVKTEKTYAGAATYTPGKAGVTLPVPTETPNGLTFSAWTKDSSGLWTSETFTELPIDFFGDLELYAVWKFSDYGVTLTADKTVSDYGEGGSTLTAAASSSVLDSAAMTFAYSWKKDDKAVAGDKATFTATDIGQHTYEVTARAQLTDSPLARGEAKKSISVTVNKGKLTVDTTYKGSPYIGMPLGDLKFANTAAKNASEEDVAGVYSWKVALKPLVEGENTVTAVFTPTDTDHYETTETEVKLTAVPVTITYDMSSSLGDSIVIDLTYGQSYTKDELRAAFTEEFDKHADFVSMTLGKAPIFTPDEGITDIKASKTVVVTFEDKTYTATFDYLYNGKTESVSDIAYNGTLTAPTAVVRRGYRVSGWYTDADCTDGNAWDFTADRMKSDTTLYAKWEVYPITLTGVEVAGEYKKEYTALEAFDPAKMKVTAVYKDETGAELREVLTAVDYVVKYVDKDGNEIVDAKLHVNTPYIKVEFAYDGVAKAQILELTVNPKQLDMSGVTFKDKTVTADGKAQTIKIVGQLPIELEPTVVYKYYLGSTEVTEAKEPGKYLVVASFTAKDKDYYAEDKQAMLIIAAPGAEVTVRWEETSLTYNGQIQHPTAIILDEDGQPIDGLSLTYGGDAVSSIDAGSYRCSVSIATAGYLIAAGGSEATAYTIGKAALKVPIYTGNFTYNGADQDVSAGLTDYDASVMEILTGGTGKDAKSYKATISLKSAAAANYKWEGSEAASVTVDWSIGKAHLTALWDTDEFIKDGNAHAPKVTGFAGLFGSDGDFIEIVYSGDYDGITDVGAYNISAAIQDKEGADVCKNYVLDGVASWAYVIVPEAGLTIVTVVWDEDNFVYDGGVKRPTATVYDRDGNVILSNVPVEYEGDVDALYAGEYTVKVDLGEGYFIKSGGTQSFTIEKDPTGAGVNPDISGNPGFDDGVGSRLPLWQVVTTGAGALAVVGGGIVAARNGNKRKKLNRETRDLEDGGRE